MTLKKYSTYEDEDYPVLYLSENIYGCDEEELVEIPEELYELHVQANNMKYNIDKLITEYIYQRRDRKEVTEQK